MDVIKFNYLLNKSLSDKEALSALYKYYYPRIVLHVKRVYPKVDAEEIAQEFFLNLLNRKSVRFVKNPSSWVYSSCRNIIIKNHSKVYNEILVDSEFSEKTVSTFIQSLNFEISLENKDMTERIFNLIEDEQTKLIIYLYHWESYNLREISAILNMKVSTVKQKYRRAINKIKQTYVSD